MIFRPFALALTVLASFASADDLAERNGPPSHGGGWPPRGGFCSFVTSEISKYHEQASATSFCSSLLSIGTKTTTATVTTTKPVTSTTVATITKPGRVPTTTITSTASITLTTATSHVTTISTLTSTVFATDSPCFTGGNKRKARRHAADQKNWRPTFCSSFNNQQLTSACDCLSLTSQTKTVTRTATVTSTSLQKSKTTTVASPTTTVTVTIVTSVAVTPSPVTITQTSVTTTTTTKSAVFKLTVASANATPGPLFLTPTLSGNSNVDWFYFAAISSGATSYSLDANCQLYNRLGGIFAQLQPGESNPGLVYSGGGTPAQCSIDLDTNETDCVNPLGGGSKTSICPYQITANTYSQWFLGDDYVDGCAQQILYAAFTS